MERKKLTCGTTWHAAGLVGQLRASLNLTKLTVYTTGLYSNLEQETGQAVPQVSFLRSSKTTSCHPILVK